MVSNIHKGLVLVVDDDPGVLQYLTLMLESQEFHVHPVHQGEEALKLTQEHDFDLILLDVMMPNIDGYEICRRLKANERTKSVPVIFLSALDGKFKKVEAFEAGAVDYVTKPFQPEEVIARVETRIQLFRQQQELMQLRQRDEVLVQQLQEDIQRREKVEAALRDSERKLRNIMEHSVDGISLVNHDGHIIEWNTGCERITGLVYSDVFQHPIWDVLHQLDHSDNPPLSYKMWQQLLIKGTIDTDSQQIEFGILMPDSNLKYVQAMIFPIPSAQGYMAGIIMRDVTRQREANQRELALGIEKERVNILTKFIQSASHEFKTPLSIIKSNLYLLKRLTESSHSFRFDIIQQQVDRINKLINGLVIMVKLDEGDIRMKDRVCMNDLARNVSNQYTQMIIDKKLTLTHDLQENLPIITGNIEYLQIAVNHIVHNAIHYTPEGGTIRIQTYQQDDMICIDVEDSGIGISEADLAHIYDSFFRVDEAHSTIGFGLGLSVAKKTIDMHQGLLHVHSQLHEGSCFTIKLPLQPTLVLTRDGIS